MYLLDGEKHHAAGDSLESGQPTPEDFQMLHMIREASSSLAEADAELQRTVRILVDFDAPSVDIILESALEIRSILSKQHVALTDRNLTKAAGDCWHAAAGIFYASRQLAEGLDGSWRAIERLTGRRMNPLQKASARFGSRMQTAEKAVVLASIGVHQVDENLKSQMTAADSTFDTPEARARKVRLEAWRADRRRRRSEEEGHPPDGAATALKD